MKYKPMFGTVSHGGGNWTVSYHKDGSACSITKQGYCRETFDRELKGLLVIRFDKASVDQVLKAIEGPAKLIKGHHHDWPGEKMYTLNEYLDFHRNINIPVEMWE